MSRYHIINAVFNYLGVMVAVYGGRSHYAISTIVLDDHRLSLTPFPLVLHYCLRSRTNGL